GVEEFIVSGNTQAFFDQPKGVVETLFREFVKLMTGTVVVLKSMNVTDGSLGKLALLLRGQLHLQRIDNLARDLLLNVEHVFEFSRVLVGPQVLVGERIDQLGGDTKTVTGGTHRS